MASVKKPKRSYKQKLSEVQSLLKVFDPHINLGSWKINITIARTPNDSDDRIVFADITTTWEYKESHLSIYPAFWKLNRRQKLAVLCHELMHVKLSKLDTLIEDLLEGTLVTRKAYVRIAEETTESFTHDYMRLIMGDT